MRYVRLICLVVLLGASPGVKSQDNNACPSVRFGSVGWLDAGAGSAVAAALLNALGYATSIDRLAAPVILASMKNQNLDVFMEIMVPTLGEVLKPYLVDNSVELVTQNLNNTKYSIATNPAGHSAGIGSFSDIAKHGESLGYQIHGTAPGSDGGFLIQKMIDQGAFELSEFKLVAQPERQLLRSLQNANRENQPIVFLAWEPHPMNVVFELFWLDGGDDIFGPRFGGADVYTGLRTGFLQDCPNAALLISRLKFNLPMINEIMTAILELKAQPLVAAVAWLRQNPDLLEDWLKDIPSRDNGDGLKTVRKFIGLDE